MSKHTEKAMELRNATPMVSNCAQAVLRAYADELGLSQELASDLASSFGGGMRCGSVCGAVTGALMVLGAKGLKDPSAVVEYQRRIRGRHDGMIECKQLLAANVKEPSQKKPHCDGMIREAIEVLDEMLEEQK